MVTVVRLPKKDVDPSHIGQASPPGRAHRQISVGIFQPLVVLLTILILPGQGIGVPLLPEAFYEAFPVGIGLQPQELLLLLGGDNPADILGEPFFVFRGELGIAVLLIRYPTG